MDGLDRDAFDAVQKVCEKLRTSGATSAPGLPPADIAPLTLERLLVYLRELARSVERHTQLGGCSGYLDFLEKFIPNK